MDVEDQGDAVAELTTTREKKRPSQKNWKEKKRNKPKLEQQAKQPTAEDGSTAEQDLLQVIDDVTERYSKLNSKGRPKSVGKQVMAALDDIADDLAGALGAEAVRQDAKVVRELERFKTQSTAVPPVSPTSVSMDGWVNTDGRGCAG